MSTTLGIVYCIQTGVVVVVAHSLSLFSGLLLFDVVCRDPLPFLFIFILLLLPILFLYGYIYIHTSTQPDLDRYTTSCLCVSTSDWFRVSTIGEKERRAERETRPYHLSFSLSLGQHLGTSLTAQLFRTQSPVDSRIIRTHMRSVDVPHVNPFQYFSIRARLCLCGFGIGGVGKIDKWVSNLFRSVSADDGGDGDRQTPESVGNDAHLHIWICCWVSGLRANHYLPVSDFSVSISIYHSISSLSTCHVGFFNWLLSVLRINPQHSTIQLINFVTELEKPVNMKENRRIRMSSRLRFPKVDLVWFISIVFVK